VPHAQFTSQPSSMASYPCYCPTPGSTQDHCQPRPACSTDKAFLVCLANLQAILVRQCPLPRFLQDNNFGLVYKMSRQHCDTDTPTLLPVNCRFRYKPCLLPYLAVTGRGTTSYCTYTSNRCVPHPVCTHSDHPPQSCCTYRGLGHRRATVYSPNTTSVQIR